ncbi:MAG: phytoene/squalene synthase family protein [Pseudomonadota bacterium]|nr:phytoene/squalene synthase family protein [Pseudomonadota bacterium]
MSDLASTQAMNTLSIHGKSFRFAGVFLSRLQLHQAARLYYFCRCIDDIADESDCADIAYKELHLLRQQLTINDASDNPLLDDFKLLQTELGLPITWPIALIDGVLADTKPFKIEQQADLIRYAYQVAGVVGLMMCPIIKANNRGHPFAVDLGIAMQLTNIARDIFEDAHLDRCYLPVDWCDCTPADIIANKSGTQKKVKLAIKRLLDLADNYYASAQVGFHFLPLRSRLAIAIASKVYQHIGTQIRRRDYCYWQGRVFVPLLTKVMLAVSAGLSLLNLPSKDRHQSALHHGLEDYIGFDESSL